MTDPDIDVESVGVADSDGESWEEAVERLSEPERCPACGAEGTLRKTLAPGQRRCPKPIDQCEVVTFMEGPRNAE